MNTLLEQREPGEFLLNEAHGSLSRNTGVLAAGNNLPAGAVLQLANGKYVEPDTTFTAPLAILYARTNAVTDTKVLLITRSASLNPRLLTWPTGFSTQDIASGIERLRQLGFAVA